MHSQKSATRRFKRLCWPLLRVWAKWRHKDPRFYERFCDTYDTHKFTVNPAPDWEEEISPKTEQTIFRDEQPRFRTLSLGEREAIKNTLESGHGFRVRIARKPGTPERATGLVEKRYSSRGYHLPQQWDDPYVFTFLEYQDGELIGTVGIRLDSEQGLAADKTYPEQMAELRREGHQLCEFTRLAVESTADSKAALATLFHAAYLWAGVVHNYNYCVIEVIPRHVPFYQRMLGFKVHGESKHNPYVGTTGVLLGIEFAKIASGLAKTQQQKAEGGLFNYGFSENEASAIVFELGQVKEEREQKHGVDSRPRPKT